MYDVAIIGAGLGGLVCAYLLSKRGMKVLVLEQNPIIGGCLQTFRRANTTFDTGFHYIGGLDKGQPLQRIFEYFNLMQLPWHKLDTQGFDEVFYQEKSYLFKNGYDNFKAQMVEYFPNDKENIEKFTALLKDVGENIFEAFSRKQEDMLEEGSLFSTGAHSFMMENVENSVLRNVVSGVSPKLPLTEKLPLYHFVQINSSFIQSAYRLKGGGMQIVEHLASDIQKFGGEILTKAKVEKLIENSGAVSIVELSDGRRFEVKNVISNVHPRELMRISEEISFIRSAQKRRYSNLENSFGMFTVNIKLKDNALKYLNRNIYIHESSDIWSEGFQSADENPKCALVSFAVPRNGDFAENVDLLTPMLWKDVEKFDSLVSKPGHRGKEYEEFKQKKAEQLILLADKYVSGLKNAVDKFYVSTPLTYRDYTSTAFGSAYGILQKMPVQKLASNIYWTGQNIGLHGILGVSMTALLTCRFLTGDIPEI